MLFYIPHDWDWTACTCAQTKGFFGFMDFWVHGDSLAEFPRPIQPLGLGLKVVIAHADYNSLNLSHPSLLVEQTRLFKKDGM